MTLWLAPCDLRAGHVLLDFIDWQVQVVVDFFNKIVIQLTSLILRGVFELFSFLL